MALQHLRSSTADKRPTPAAMSDGQLALNTNLVSPGLFFKDSNGDSVKIGPVHVGTTAPNVTPGAGGQAGNSKGEQWLDTSSSRYVFKIWDGTAWRSEDGEFVNVSGDTMTGALGIIAGTAAAPGVFFSGDPNSGIYSPGADQVAVATNGTQRLTVDTAATTSTLPVVHPLGAVGTPSITFTGDLNTGFYSPAADTLAAVTAGSNRLHITSGGLVGIGTSSPDVGLHYRGDTPKLRIESSNTLDTVAGTEEIGRLEWEGFKNTNFNAAASIRARQDGTWSTSTQWIAPSALEFYTQDNTGVEVTAPRMLIDSSGRVGIGTTSPAVLLDVVGASNQLRVSTGAANSFYGFDTAVDSCVWKDFTDGSDYVSLHNNNSIRFGVASSERARIDSSGRLLVGTSTSVNTFGVAPKLQVAGGESYQSNIAYRADAFAPFISVGHSRSATVGAQTILQSGDDFGTFAFAGSDGTGLILGAQISAAVDGTPGTNDMPGRLVFSTTADGASSPTERLRITNDGVIAYDQPTPATYAAAATITVADLKTGIITYTGTAATLTLPTGTLTEGGFSGIYTNMAFEWSVINTGAGICTIGAGTTHTIVGSGTVAIGASARFASRRTAANTFVSYRLS